MWRAHNCAWAGRHPETPLYDLAEYAHSCFSWWETTAGFFFFFLSHKSCAYWQAHRVNLSNVNSSASAQYGTTYSRQLQASSLNNVKTKVCLQRLCSDRHFCLDCLAGAHRRTIMPPHLNLWFCSVYLEPPVVFQQQIAPQGFISLYCVLGLFLCHSALNFKKKLNHKSDYHKPRVESILCLVAKKKYVCMYM